MHESPPEKDASTSEWTDKSVSAVTLAGRGGFPLANTRPELNVSERQVNDDSMRQPNTKGVFKTV